MKVTAMWTEGSLYTLQLYFHEILNIMWVPRIITLYI